MKIKIGDTVRFLNDVGGGIVTRIEQRQNLVYVEDENGFEVPTLITECIVVPPVNKNTNFPLKDFASGAAPATEQRQVEVESRLVMEEEVLPLLEVEGGDTLRAFLAFFPEDIKKMNTTAYDSYLINDSNYFLFYNFVIGEKANRRSVANGILEPNIQEELCRIKKEELNDWEHLSIQLVAFKKEKAYTEQKALDYSLKLNVVRFYKLHSFTEGEYFDEPHLLVDLIKGEGNKKLREIDPDEIKAAIYEKETSKPLAKKKQAKKKRQRINDVIEVDLHVNSLLDSTAGMSNAEILEYQMDVFHNTLSENSKKRGQRIVFIHGKGEGVLRSEIEKQLKRRYKTYYFQDASFKEYGFGATMVTIS